MALRTLYQAYLHSDIGRLRIIARQWGLEPQAVRHTDLAAELVSAILDAEKISQVIAALPLSNRDALDDILRRGGMMPWSSFLRRWGPMREVGMGKMEREELWRDPCSPAEALWLLGLLQRDFTEDLSDPIEMAYIPEQLQLYIPEPDPAIIHSLQPEETDSEGASYSVNDTMAEDLVTWWIAIQKAQATDVENTLAQLHKPVYLRESLCRTLSLEQDWVRFDQEQDVHMNPEPVLKWLRADLWTQWSSLARAWVESMQWHDIDYIPSLYVDPANDWAPNPLQARQAVLDWLPQCKVGSWYSLIKFVAYIKSYTPDFMRPDGNYERWAPRDRISDRPLRGFESWDDIEGAYIRFLMTGPLSWFGIVDVKKAQNDNHSDIFQLTHAGAALLGVGEPPHIPAPTRMTIEHNGILLVPNQRHYERYQLSRIAQLESFDTVSQFRITPRSLKRAQQRNIPLPRIINFLEQASGQQIPSQLGTAMERSYHQHSYASLQHLWLLRVPEMNDATIPALQDYIVEQLTPTILVIQERDRACVIAILYAQGILVDVSDR
ncbi:MAG: helicase-associated domain-containing protein [Anaerolineae bacterium]|nr:helicase-associated domain-containing protein [Anaerolineae bacterium]